MVKWFLLHEWKEKTRSTFWQKSIGINILLGLLAFYLILNMLALGFYLGPLLEKAYPGQTPFDTFNDYLLYYLLFDLLMRFFLADFPLLDLQRYLLLPVKKSKIFHFLLLKSIANYFNILPLFFVIPFALRVVFPNYPPGEAGAWLVLILVLILINHYLAFYLKRTFNVRPVVAFGLVAAVVGLIVLGMRGILPLASLFGQAVQVIVQQPFWLAVPLGLLAGVYYFLYTVFGQYAYLDALSDRPGRPAATGQNFAALNRLGRLGPLVQLDLHLILRNKRPRTMLIISVLMLAYGLIFAEMLDTNLGFVIFAGVIVTGMGMANYGQFMLSWESSFFDLLMGRNFSMRDYYDAKFYLFLGFNLVATLVCLLYALVDWRLPLVFLAVALYNVGVNSFVTMFFSTYNTRRIDPDKQAFFNYQGVGASQFLYLIPLFLGPVLIYLPFSLTGFRWWGVAAVALTGILGLLFKPQWLNLITRQFQTRKYIVTSAFKNP